MKWSWGCLALLLAVVAWLPGARGQTTRGSNAVDVVESNGDEVTPQPVVSGDGTWAGVVVIVAGGLILAAGCIGVVVRLHGKHEGGDGSRREI